MSAADIEVDAVVIGAGAGGVAAAARLQAGGYRTLLVEKYDRVGGRASTVDIDGFRVNTGALIIEAGGENKRLFDDLGVDPGWRLPRRPVVLRLGRVDVPLMNGPTGVAVKVLLAGIGSLTRATGMRARPDRTLADWLDSRKAGAGVRALARNICGAMFAAEPSDVELALLLDYLLKKDALQPYAMHPEGSIGPWRALIADFEARGGTLWLNSEVAALTVGADGHVDTAQVRHDGTAVAVRTRVVVSNAGPVATAGLAPLEAIGADYVARVREWSRPGALMTINFASRERLGPVSGLVFFGGRTRRLAYAAALTDTCPETAPPGWHLYLGAGSPFPATGEFDAEAEVALLREDLREHFPGFERARELSVQICAGEEWPAQRAIAGHDLGRATPIPNLWNVGDGVREWAIAGQSGCVHSARLVTEIIRRNYPPTPEAERPRPASAVGSG